MTAAASSREAPDEVLDLVHRCRSGDDLAWRRLYEMSFDFVYRTSRRLGVPDSEAEDVTQEVFLVAHRKLEDFTTGRFTTWLYRICANIVMDRQRRKRIRSALVSLKAWFWGAEPETPDRHVERAYAETRVEEILGRMSPKKREVLVLFELEALSGEEIAERVGCSESAVFTRLHHARKEFAAIARRLDCFEPGGTT